MNSQMVMLRKIYYYLEEFCLTCDTGECGGWDLWNMRTWWRRGRISCSKCGNKEILDEAREVIRS